MIEQLQAQQMPRFAQHSVALIGIIQKDLRINLNEQGFDSHIFLHDMDEVDLFIFKLDRDYFWIYMFRNLQQDHPVTFVETSCMQSAESSVQRLLHALNISVDDGLEIHYDNTDIQRIAIYSQLNLE